MTVTTFLLVLMSFIIGGAMGAASYIWLQKKELKKKYNEIVSSLDFHSLKIGNNIDIGIAKSGYFDGEHFMCIKGPKTESYIYIDSNSGEILSCESAE